MWLKKFFGGVSVYTIRLANALSGSNNVSVLMLRNLLPKFMYPGKKHVGMPDNDMNFMPGIRTFNGMDWNNPLSWRRAYAFLKEEQPDVIIMQWWTSSVAHMELVLALANRSKIKSRLIIEMHEIVDPLEAGNPVLRFYSRVTGKLIANRADAFVSHSISMKEEMVRIYHLKDEKVFVIPHGLYDIYPQEYKREAARNDLAIEEPFVILYFGFIRRYKGIPYLVEAFNRLPADIASRSKLIIAGEDWGDDKYLGTMIKQSPYYKQILFKPEFIPNNAVPAYFAAADVVVLPYLRTSGSGVTSLAIAYGKPIIISDLEHTREALKEYEGAIFVPCGDAAGISAKIAELFERQHSGETVSYGVPPEKNWTHIRGEFEGMINKIMDS